MANKTDPVDPADMPMTFLECHAEGHWWKYQGVSNVLTAGRSKRVREFTREYKCMRCPETKSVTRNADFSMPVPARYKPPPGWTIARDDDHKGEFHRYTALRELMARDGFELD